VNNTTKILTFLGLMLLLFFILVWFTGCYTPSKARKQFGRVAATYPTIPADYCGRVYPCDTLYNGADTITTVDTIYTDPEVEIYTDTILVQNPFDYVTISFKKDSVYLFHLNEWKAVKNKMKPVTITKTVTIRDTIKLLNTASLDACNIERKAETERANNEQQLKEKFRGQRNTAWWILAGIGASGLLYLFFMFRRKAIK
jgi:hypothetical protein